MSTKPIVTAIIICDNVYQDKFTNKTVLSGIFTNIVALNFPTQHGNLGLYIALSDVATAGRVQVVLRNIENESISIPIPPLEVKKPSSRFDTVEVIANLSGIPIPCEGKYAFVVHWNDSCLFEKRINVLKLKKGNPND